MLGRLVDQYVVQNGSVRPEALWSDVLPLMLSAECRLMNLECVISSEGEKWHPTTKAFHFRAQPRAIEFSAQPILTASLWQTIMYWTMVRTLFWIA